MTIARATGVARVLACATVLIAAGGGAQPAVPAPGVCNFHRVNDSVYRGGQPFAQGFRSLAKLGIKTVLDLRHNSMESAWEEREVKSLGMRYVQLALSTIDTPT